MRYCPNCSAYQHDTESELCPKCGFDVKTHRELQEAVPEEKKKEPKDLSRYDDSKPCRICGSPTREIHKELQVSVEGSRINMYGIKLMGGEITKRTATRIDYEIVGRECAEGHLFYGDVSYKKRPICPLCYDPLMIYGTSLFSCSRCSKHFPMGDWPDPDPEETLKEEGWEQL